MRATINFEADVDRVQQIMWALAFQEMDPLHQAMDFVETAKPHELHEGITNALDLIHRVAQQLGQYRDMIASFERARLETILPQEVDEAVLEPVPPPAAQVVARAAFDHFVDGIGSDTEEGVPDDPEEG
jgi:hypothetical protein